MLTVVLHSLTNATPMQEQLAGEAVQLLKKVLIDADFWRLIQQAQYSRRWFRTPEGQLKQLSNEDITYLMAVGVERSTTADGEIDLSVNLARLPRSTLGFVAPPNPLITTNNIYVDKWIDENDPLSLAAHWMHEWMHVAGARHRKVTPIDRAVVRRDVAYTVSRMVVAAGRRIVGDTALLEANTFELGFGYLEASGADDCPVIDNTDEV